MKAFDIPKTRKACAIADTIFKQLIVGLKKRSFNTELDIYNFLMDKTKENNCVVSFPPIVAMQENAYEIHHIPDDSKLKKGFLMIDFGVKYKSYCSDCTRTFYIYGKPSKKEKEFYNLILEAHLTALNHTAPGVYAADIDLIARTVLQDYPWAFVHSTGHGVGKKIHQPPSLYPGYKFKLKKNQTITIEPGLYFKNKFGIRIEDTLIVKENPEVLTKIPKKLIIIK